MSSRLECEFIHDLDGTWYYALQNWDCPSVYMDWREHARAYGPFDTLEVAVEHLHHAHENPGGYDVVEMVDIGRDGTWRQLIATAVPPRT